MLGGYIYNRPADGKVWRSVNVEGAENIPVFLGYVWPGSCPEDMDEPPNPKDY